MRCPDCNRFVSFEEQEPEVNNLEVDGSGHVTASVRIVNACQECSNELTEAKFEMEIDVDAEGHTGEGHDLEVDEGSADRTSRQGYFVKGKFVSKGGRYGKTFYGASLSFTVKCSCGKLGEDGGGVEGTLEDEIQASDMNVLV